jgi:hypothetical protein
MFLVIKDVITSKMPIGQGASAGIKAVAISLAAI